jgi:hypothetical protein
MWRHWGFLHKSVSLSPSVSDYAVCSQNSKFYVRGIYGKLSNKSKFRESGLNGGVTLLEGLNKFLF